MSKVVWHGQEPTCSTKPPGRFAPSEQARVAKLNISTLGDPRTLARGGCQTGVMKTHRGDDAE